VVAATAMIRHLNKADSVQGMQEQKIWLRHLLKSMETVQPHFPIVRRMLDSLKQICGSGPLCSLFPSTHRDSTHASTHEVSAQSQSLDLSSRLNNVQDNSLAVGSGPDIVWDSIGSDIAPGVFSFGRFDDFVLDLAPSEAAVSNWAQAVT